MINFLILNSFKSLLNILFLQLCMILQRTELVTTSLLSESDQQNLSSTSTPLSKIWPAPRGWKNKRSAVTPFKLLVLPRNKLKHQKEVKKILILMMIKKLKLQERRGDSRSLVLRWRTWFLKDKGPHTKMWPMIWLKNLRKITKWKN